MFRRFLQSRSGATSIEYALIAVLIAVVIVGGVTATGNKVNGIFTAVATGLK